MVSKTQPHFNAWNVGQAKMADTLGNINYHSQLSKKKEGLQRKEGLMERGEIILKNLLFSFPSFEKYYTWSLHPYKKVIPTTQWVGLYRHLLIFSWESWTFGFHLLKIEQKISDTWVLGCFKVPFSGICTRYSPPQAFLYMSRAHRHLG